MRNDNKQIPNALKDKIDQLEKENAKLNKDIDSANYYQSKAIQNLKDDNAELVKRNTVLNEYYEEQRQFMAQMES